MSNPKYTYLDMIDAIQDGKDSSDLELWADMIREVGPVHATSGLSMALFATLVEDQAALIESLVKQGMEWKWRYENTSK